MVLSYRVFLNYMFGKEAANSVEGKLSVFEGKLTFSEALSHMLYGYFIL